MTLQSQEQAATTTLQSPEDVCDMIALGQQRMTKQKQEEDRVEEKQMRKAKQEEDHVEENRMRKEKQSVLTLLVLLVQKYTY
jgi:hypothetical protein